ncbi:toll/interleukin-1 receptor domain-containing protein [Mammaliicoccus sciuri]|uniref:toll/interleukin-1 receptor domain-containing protein n=1 Tax=Mammaliicoccus sciuri TaxID=1296 RepID=UPI001E4327C1|nr:toll/interleukin-1 receptor domain-containing protein [Mammaliicoccus sciuri]MCD8875201.1 toll/interleukin-1 receptor domain-containing protein [Mammaliicoccus sciuri]
MINGLKIKLEENKGWIDSSSKLDTSNIKKDFKKLAESIISETEEIAVFDAMKIMNEHFNKELNKFDVFISHSHQNLEEVLKLAKIIEDKGKKVFIDSLYWNFADDLLKELDNKYCRNDNSDSFDYSKRNISTALVHSILSNSLQMMIDRCDTFLFLNSDNINHLTIEKYDKNYTTSPWIYTELLTANIILTNRLTYKSENARGYQIYNGTKDIYFMFDLEQFLKNLTPVNSESNLLKELGINGK